MNAKYISPYLRDYCNVIIIIINKIIRTLYDNVVLLGRLENREKNSIYLTINGVFLLYVKAHLKLHYIITTIVNSNVVESKTVRMT